ncbi:hypothetical protein B0T19DRAFT_106426 [Cercophora scortea]|uniref:Uncharacterized protein n=1 Tax=Cercophora scortea TaxID=314031 RepID=A0AAE0IWP4_9PEZI|nr:hypothetical protein B0T19DRAFT_106426 [Cercophora scortea]
MQMLIGSSLRSAPKLSALSIHKTLAAPCRRCWFLLGVLPRQIHAPIGCPPYKWASVWVFVLSGECLGPHHHHHQQRVWRCRYTEYSTIRISPWNVVIDEVHTDRAVHRSRKEGISKCRSNGWDPSQAGALRCRHLGGLVIVSLQLPAGGFDLGVQWGYTSVFAV